MFFPTQDQGSLQANRLPIQISATPNQSQTLLFAEYTMTTIFTIVYNHDQLYFSDDFQIIGVHVRASLGVAAVRAADKSTARMHVLDCMS